MFFIPPPFTIKPYYKKRSLCFRECNGTTSLLSNLSGYNLAYDATQNMKGEGFIPDTFRAGTGVQIVMYGAIRDTNETGVAKTVVIAPNLYRGRDGVVGSEVITPDKTLIPVPDGELANTVQQITLATISGLQAGDFFAWRLLRSHTDTDDTWDYNYWLSRKVVLKYIADKIGVDI